LNASQALTWCKFHALQGWNSEGAYSPYSSMSALPWQPGAMFAAPDGSAFPDDSSSSDASSSGADEGDDVEPSLAEVGVPVLEVFLRRDGQGRLLRQAAVLKQERGPDGEPPPNSLLGAFGTGGGTPYHTWSFQDPRTALGRGLLHARHVRVHALRGKAGGTLSKAYEQRMQARACQEVCTGV
jgi:hypothetical protein